MDWQKFGKFTVCMDVLFLSWMFSNTLRLADGRRASVC